MSRDNIVYTACGFLLGLVIGSFLLGPKLARSKLAGPDATPDSAASAPMTAPSAAPESAAMPPAAEGQMTAVRQQLDLLKKQLDQNPNDFDALVQLGNMYMDVGKFPQAIDYYTRALAVREEPAIRTDLGICYKQSGQSAKAREAFERVATERPDEWQAIYNLAIVDGEMKNYADARVQLAKLKQIRPNDPEVMKLEQALASVR
jgi:tetratricopeptide (TPR) repeat protein